MVNKISTKKVCTKKKSKIKKNKRKSKKQKGGNFKKIAFCFLIYDEIVHEDIWNNFFKKVDKSRYSIYIHYKNNKKLKFFEDNKLKNCIETGYGDITSSMFKDWDSELWQNVLVAGGSVLASILPPDPL